MKAMRQDTALQRVTDSDLTAAMEPFDSFWEGPEDIERGYGRFARFYAHNYLPLVPEDRDARVLVVSCGPGYMVNLLVERGYTSVHGIDSSPEKVAWAERRGLPCTVAQVFTYLENVSQPLDLIFCEQEINHLTKKETLAFLDLCRTRLSPGGRIIVHSINGATPLTGSESRAGNFDHYYSLTEYSLGQVLKHSGFEAVRAFPLNLYVFWSNPLNYVALAIHGLWTLFFRINFTLVGKNARIFTKKIGATGTAPRS